MLGTRHRQICKTLSETMTVRYFAVVGWRTACRIGKKFTWGRKASENRAKTDNGSALYGKRAVNHNDNSALRNKHVLGTVVRARSGCPRSALHEKEPSKTSKIRHFAASARTGLHMVGARSGRRIGKTPHVGAYCALNSCRKRRQLPTIHK